MFEPHTSHGMILQVNHIPESHPPGLNPLKEVFFGMFGGLQWFPWHLLNFIQASQMMA